MKRPTLPLTVSLLLALGFVACQSPVVKTGEEAAAAYQEWIDGGTFLKPLEYPSQMHVDYLIDMTMDMSSVGMAEPMAMDMALNADYIVDGVDAVRSWGNFEFGAKLEGEEHRLNFDFEIADDADGFRLLIDDHGVIQEEFGMDVPKAFFLSQDRLIKFLDLYGGLMEDMSEVYGFDINQIYAGVQGPGDLFHPASFMRFMANADVFEVVGWRTSQGTVQIDAKLEPGFMEGALAGTGAAVDSQLFDDMVFVIVADLDSGAMLDYAVQMALPIETPLAPGSDQVMKMDMDLNMHFYFVDVDTKAPNAELPAPGGYMNLNDSFDQYLPLIEAALDMQRQQLRQMMGEKEGGEDFTF